MALACGWLRPALICNLSVAICPDLLSGRRDLPRSALICSSVVGVHILVAVAICILVHAICPDLPWSDLLACALLSSGLICLLVIAIYLDLLSGCCDLP